MSLTLAFDIGYASIGWCVLSAPQPAPAQPDIVATGVVTFPTDDCLASQRRNLRRTRRHIRSTRQRIERLKQWLLHHGVLSRQELDRPGHPAPFLLAAAALQKHHQLSAFELWTVLRWYAHNRGYDGNSRWSRDEESGEDTEKETHAIELMQQHGTETMAETVCACLRLDPAKFRKRISSTLPYKTLNAAYPRRVVTQEVGRLLSLHLGQIPGLDPALARMILTADDLTADERKRLTTEGIRLPKRYSGGLLFGQLVPRFDNRIIARCPITWAKTFDEATQSGQTEDKARQLADKFSKVPAAKCREFLEYRFARILANLRADGQPLDRALRKHLWDLASSQGSLTAATLQKEIRAHCGDVETNTEAYFNLHPDSADALVLDPVKDEVRKATGARAKISTIWNLLPEPAKQAAQTTWSRGKKITYAQLLEISGNPPSLLKALEENFAKDNKPKRGQKPYATFEDYLRKSGVAAKYPTGRAPYAKPVLRQVVEEVLAGFDSTKACAATDPEKGEAKPANGVLYDLNVPTSRVREVQNKRPLDQLTNNHLVRHRLLILDRLIDDLITEFPNLAKADTQVIVEVARELKEFSGKDRVAIKSAENAKIAQHKSAEKRLIEKGIYPTYALIKKCRIAMDLNWTCPFTHRDYGEAELADLQFEHIIPRSKRLSDSMAGLVLTRAEINALKGNRTARRFILDHADDDRIVSPDKYKKWVESLKVARKESYPDDYARQSARKRLLMIEDYEDKDRTFTEGQLTQTSHLVKLATKSIRQKLVDAPIFPIPGPVTAEIRKAWKLTGALALACPEVLNERGEVRPKEEIRNLTHLHHALDAATIGFTAHYFPFIFHGENQSGKLWKSIIARNKTEEDVCRLRATQLYKFHTKLDSRGREVTRASLNDLPTDLKNALARSLAQSRVMQHIPADRSGTRAELTTWGIVTLEGKGTDARVKLRQRTTTIENKRRVIVPKEREERAGKLLGPMPKAGSGKLQAISGALIINENYGLCLDPAPRIISFHNVQSRLDEIWKANGGKPVRILRNGMLIRLTNQGDRDGIWQIKSIKASLKLDLTRPQIFGRPDTGLGVWREVSVAGLIKRHLEILPQRYTGYPA
ncbi:hypothetical protein KBB96_13275 [Luteolibacter ambystomatis]|uniref:HNH Cas9-type domain-containing protein n=1 Tax=Luteolibacter ambystomatis TaxID=2824561 RepID=A0A975G7R0_9BACT|nr:type II CRISPR RNA-guided endonuclease Cas9 [Luteolibacter ambystomatis]QUE49840.1 hypothetical protein KBB96_13275 [Luteolibacter ambystomatis]